jgi:hypothetical protein
VTNPKFVLAGPQISRDIHHILFRVRRWRRIGMKEMKGMKGGRNGEQLTPVSSMASPWVLRWR